MTLVTLSQLPGQQRLAIVGQCRLAGSIKERIGKRLHGSGEANQKLTDSQLSTTIDLWSTKDNR